MSMSVTVSTDVITTLCRCISLQSRMSVDICTPLKILWKHYGNFSEWKQLRLRLKWRTVLPHEIYYKFHFPSKGLSRTTFAWYGRIWTLPGIYRSVPSMLMTARRCSHVNATSWLCINVIIHLFYGAVLLLFLWLLSGTERKVKLCGNWSWKVVSDLFSELASETHVTFGEFNHENTTIMTKWLRVVLTIHLYKQTCNNSRYTLHLVQIENINFILKLYLMIFVQYNIFV